jgi:hypothetical protein
MKITIDISDKLITDAIGSAGIGYWADTRRGTWNPKTMRLVVYETGDTKPKTHRLTREHFERGLALLAVKCPEHYRALVEENGDMYTGDALVQCACFPALVADTSELKYG